MFMVNVSVHARINMTRYLSGKVVAQYLALHDLHGLKSSKVILNHPWERMNNCVHSPELSKVARMHRAIKGGIGLSLGESMINCITYAKVSQKIRVIPVARVLWETMLAHVIKGMSYVSRVIKLTFVMRGYMTWHTTVNDLKQVPWTVS